MMTITYSIKLMIVMKMMIRLIRLNWIGTYTTVKFIVIIIIIINISNRIIIVIHLFIILNVVIIVTYYYTMFIMMMMMTMNFTPRANLMMLMSFESL